MPKARLSMAFENLSGSLPDGVAYPSRGGVRLRAKPDYRYSVKPDVAAGNARMALANAAYWTMTQSQVDAWTRWGVENPRTDPITGTVYPSDSRNAFVGLALKILQIDPAAALPRLPPKGRLAPQRLKITILPEPPSSRGSSWRGRVGGEESALDLLPALRFTASAPTRPDRLVEIKIQPLKHLLCKPQKFYKSHGFVAFTPESLSVEIPLPPGAYAVAVQQVEPATGRTAAFTPLGKLELP